MDLFDVDTRELIALRKWYKKQPAKFKRATAEMLNAFAFGARRSALDLITKRMTIRNPKFIASRFRVTKATTSSQRSVMGTLSGPRFSGFVEQELGVPTDRTRTATMAARSGSRSSQIKPRFRLKPSNDVVTMRDYKVDRVSAFVAMIFERKETRLVRIKGAILKRKGKRLQLIQQLNSRKKQPRKRPFLQTSRVIYFRSINLKALWSKTLARIMTPPPR
jgi:hypothetical protein